MPFFLIEHKYHTMLLDNIFKSSDPVEIVIIRKNGQLKHKTRPAQQTTEHEPAPKPLFPINKERE